MHLRKLFLFCFLATAVAGACNSSADIALPKLFSDHMVLQQKKALKIWGTAEPDQGLIVKFNKLSINTTANSNGEWSAIIKTGSAGGPYQLIVADAKKETKVIFSNVMVGEVWICGGQANMQMPVSETITAETDIELAKEFPTIRLFNVEHHASSKPLNDFARVNPWYCCSSDTIKDFSAIGYFFGRELSRKLNVPIGLIDISRRGTTLEAWTPNDAIKSDGRFSELLEHWQSNTEPNNPNRVSNSFNAMVNPLTRFPIGGVIWYQGASNIGRGEQYSRLFPLMIKSWRNKFGGEEFPFYFVQLAPHRYEDFSVVALPEIWDAQLKTFNQTANSGMVVTTDIGDSSNFKRKSKLMVAQRLANWAFGNCYKQQIQDFDNGKDHLPNELTANNTNGTNSKSLDDVQFPENTINDEQNGGGGQSHDSNQPPFQFSGPIFESAEFKSEQIIVSFRFVESGLNLDNGAENGFTICGPDKKFVPASAKVAGSKIIVLHPEIPRPLAVRYGWRDTAKPVLTGKGGLPASPFRTDDFPLSSNGIEF